MSIIVVYTSSVLYISNYVNHQKEKACLFNTSKSKSAYIKTDRLKMNATNYLPGFNMGVVPPSRQWGTGREIKGTETCALTMTREGAPLMTGFTTLNN